MVIYSVVILDLLCLALSAVGFVMALIALIAVRKDSMSIGTVVQCKKGWAEPHGFMPVYMTEGSAMADVCLPKAVEIKSHTTEVVDLMLAFDIPKGWCVKVHARSSLLIKHGLLFPTGVIDSDYKNNIHATLFNASDKTVFLPQGARVAQLELCKMTNVPGWRRMDRRRIGAFGSTD